MRGGRADKPSDLCKNRFSRDFKIGAVFVCPLEMLADGICVKPNIGIDQIAAVTAEQPHQRAIVDILAEIFAVQAITVGAGMEALCGNELKVIRLSEFHPALRLIEADVAF